MSGQAPTPEELETGLWNTGVPLVEGEILVGDQYGMPCCVCDRVIPQNHAQTLTGFHMGCAAEFNRIMREAKHPAADEATGGKEQSTFHESVGEKILKRLDDEEATNIPIMAGTIAADRINTMIFDEPQKFIGCSREHALVASAIIAAGLMIASAIRLHGDKTTGMLD